MRSKILLWMKRLYFKMTHSSEGRSSQYALRGRMKNVQVPVINRNTLCWIVWGQSQLPLCLYVTAPEGSSFQLLHKEQRHKEMPTQCNFHNCQENPHFKCLHPISHTSADKLILRSCKLSLTYSLLHHAIIKMALLAGLFLCWRKSIWKNIRWYCLGNDDQKTLFFCLEFLILDPISKRFHSGIWHTLSSVRCLNPLCSDVWTPILETTQHVSVPSLEWVLSKMAPLLHKGYFAGHSIHPLEF